MQKFLCKDITNNKKLIAKAVSLMSVTFDDPTDIIYKALKDFNKNNNINARIFALINNNDVIATALLFKMGVLVDKKVNLYHCANVCYAFCVEESKRNKGFGSALMKFILNYCTESNTLCVVSPANQSLVPYYEQFGFIPYFYTQKYKLKFIKFDETITNIKKINFSEFLKIRENFLTNTQHISISTSSKALFNMMDTKFYLIDDSILISTDLTENNKIRITEVIAASDISVQKLSLKLNNFVDTFCSSNTDVYTPLNMLDKEIFVNQQCILQSMIYKGNFNIINKSNSNLCKNETIEKHHQSFAYIGFTFD